MILILNQLMFRDFDFKSSEISMILILKLIQNQNYFMIPFYSWSWSNADRLFVATLLLPTIYNGQQNIYKKYSSIWIKSETNLI